MAKGPGPALLLAGAAALLLMRGKKKGTETGIRPANGGTSDADVGGGPANGSKPSGNGGAAKPSKTVPNVSGDPDGYNTELYPGPLPVRMGLLYLGYDIAQNMQPLTDAQAVAAVKSFQTDYNAGDTTVEQGPYAGDSVPGYLEVDGVAGPNTLNALEIVIAGFPTGKWNSYYN